MRIWKLLANTLREGMQDDLPDRAAALSFYFLFSMFPLLLLLAALLGIFHAAAMIHNAIAGLAGVLPRSAARLVAGQLRQLLRQPREDLLSLGTGLLLYSGSQGIFGLMSALNTTYEVSETRSYPHRLALSFLLSLSAGFFLASGLALLLLGSKLLVVVFGARRAGWGMRWIWPALRWLLAYAFLITAVFLLYRHAPNVGWGDAGAANGRKHRSASVLGIWPAAPAAMVLWGLSSFGLTLYLDYLGGDSAVYGSLGAVIALMMWFYLGALAILLGAEFHCEWLKLRGIHLPVRRSLATPKLPAA